VPSIADLVAAHLATDGDVPHVLRDVFPDPSPERIDAAVRAFCAVALGAPVASAEFFAAGVGSVHGVRLADGRRVVVKVHPPRASAAYVDAMQAVQRHLAAAGFPAPQPLVPPARLGRGLAVAETLLDRGAPPDGRDPAQRCAMAAGLARLVALARPLAGLPGLRDSIMTSQPGALWPTPHDGRFDFAATAGGAEWIDRTEAALVASVAHMFTANWASGQPVRAPTRDEALGFVADYAAARAGGPWSESEARVARAALVWTMAYTARCEHSDARTDFGRRAPDPPAGAGPAAVADDGARGFLAAHAAALLGTGVGPVPDVVPSS
jgi:Phosphotransferase enzyme family